MSDPRTDWFDFLRDLAFTKGRLKRSFRLAVKSLWLHRLRSFLTMLGIVFGVCSVIAMLAIGEGASSAAQEEIRTLGSQNIIIRSIKPPEEQKVSNNRQNFVLDYGLKPVDLRRIEKTIPGVATVVPARIMREYVWQETRRVDAEVFGTVPRFLETRNQRVATGRFFSDAEMEQGANVCVLGAEVAEKLFPIESALGKSVRVGSKYYRVIGIMEPVMAATKDQPVMAGSSAAPQNRMFMPLSTTSANYGEILVKRRSGSFEAERVALHEITVRTAEGADVSKISLAIQQLLERYHPKKDYDIVVPLELLRRAEQTKQIFNIVLGSIAAISLLVGGIGIMNIMLANVTERTREIGIRRALGARRRDIVTQFLVESVMLSGCGGVVGVGLGILIPFAVTYFSQMKTIVTFGAPVIAFTISAVVGIVFGLYPAIRAANMDPVEALRHE